MQLFIDLGDFRLSEVDLLVRKNITKTDVDFLGPVPSLSLDPLCGTEFPTT